MSTVFSRRSFLKYTAVTAVAVAGTSLLGGCSDSGSTPPKTDIGSSNSALKVQSTLTKLDYSAEANTATFELHIRNGRWNDLHITNVNFYVYADEKLYQAGNLEVALKPGSASGPQIDRGQEADYLITVKDLDPNVQTLTLTFMPDVQYNESDYQCVWSIDRKKFAPDEASGT